MNRSVGMERTYVLGQYKNLKLSDYISDIPQEVFLNQGAITALRQLQLHHLEETFLRYLKDAATVNEDILHADEDTLEEIISRVEDHRVTSFENLKEAFAEIEQSNIETVTEE